MTMSRRLLIASAATTAGAATFATPALQAAAAEQPAAGCDAFAFIDDSLSTEDVATIVLPDNAAARRRYVAYVTAAYGGLSPRDQLRAFLAQNHRTQARAIPLIPIIAIAGRALLAAVKKFGPKILAQLKTAVQKGYAAFNEWTKQHPWVSGIIGGIAGTEIHAWLKDNL